MPSTIDPRTNAQRHLVAATEIDVALRPLRRALIAEGDLEFGDWLRDTIEECEAKSRRMKEYAEKGW